MSNVVKAIRLQKSEWEQIQLFLTKNTFFDFSSLSRLAIKEFIHNPKLKIKRIDNQSTSLRRSKGNKERS
jgi:hypothetical protein